MREILFRGFHPCDGPETIVVDGEKVRGRWVYGYYIGPVKGLIAHEICDIDDITGHSLDVLPSTVGQYTGLTDKNGRRIFEGDRISYTWGDWDKSPMLDIVRWENHSCGFEPFSDSEENCRHCGGGLNPKNSVVIGTVFDEEKG